MSRVSVSRFPVLTAAVLLVIVTHASAQQVGLAGYMTPAYIQFSSPSYVVESGQSNAVVTVVRTGEFREPSTVQYATQDGTAHAGVDYLPASGTLSFPAGAGTATFSVKVSASAGSSVGTVQLQLINPGYNVVVTRPNATLDLGTAAASTFGPPLFVRPNGRGNVVISWPANAMTCILERTQDPLSGRWTTVPTIPASSDGRMLVTEEASSERFFYRLRKP